MELEARPGEKEPREWTLATGICMKGVCLREEAFLAIEIQMVESTIKSPLAKNKLPLKINLSLNQTVHVS